MGSYQIPFDAAGNQLDYPGWSKNVWKDNFEFEDFLTYKSYGRGRSSITFTMERANGGMVSVFVSDFDDMLPYMTFGKLHGRFTFVKKGQNYGCKLLEVTNV